MSVPGELVSANVTTGSSPVSLGALPQRGTATLTGALAGCPCVLQSLELGLSGQELSATSGLPAVSGSLTITAVDVHSRGRWQPLGPRALASAAAWKERNTTRHPPDVISAGPGGLRWEFSGVPGTEDPILQSADTPAVLPGAGPASLTAGRTGVFTGVAWTAARCSCGRSRRSGPCPARPPAG